MGSQTSFLCFTRSCTSTLFSTHPPIKLYPSPPPDSISSSAFFYLSHHPTNTTYFSSLSHHLSIKHVPSHLNRQLQSPVQPSSLTLKDKPSQHSHTCPLKSSYLFGIRGPSLTSIRHCTLHTRHILLFFDGTPFKLIENVLPFHFKCMSLMLTGD